MSESRYCSSESRNTSYYRNNYSSESRTSSESRVSSENKYFKSNKIKQDNNIDIIDELINKYQNGKINRYELEESIKNANKNTENRGREPR